MDIKNIKKRKTYQFWSELFLLISNGNTEKVLLRVYAELNSRRAFGSNTNALFSRESLEYIIKNHKKSFDYFCKTYTPIKNILVKHPSMDGYAFEISGEELEFVKKQNPKTIWTVLDCDGKIILQAGYHFVNRLNYLITEKKWTDEELEFEV
jgi:hypothetical protein